MTANENFSASPLADYSPDAFETLMNNPHVMQAEADVEKAGELNRFIKDGDIDGFIAALAVAMNTPAITYDMISGYVDRVTLAEIWTAQYGPVLGKYETVTTIANAILDSEALIGRLSAKVRFTVVDALFLHFDPEHWSGWRVRIMGAGHTHEQINAQVLVRLRHILALLEAGKEVPALHVRFARMLLESPREPGHTYRPFYPGTEALIINVLGRLFPDEASALNRVQRALGAA